MVLLFFVYWSNKGILIYVEKFFDDGSICNPANDDERRNDPLLREYCDYIIKMYQKYLKLIESTFVNIMKEFVNQENIKKMKIKRLGKADEVAKTILFLASYLSNYITGQIIRIDGGIK